MKYDILRQETDMAGKIRLWVDLGNGQVQILKFGKMPGKGIIQAEVDKVLAQPALDKMRELETIDQEIARLQERKAQLEAKAK